MLDELKTANKVVGMKQLRRAFRDGTAQAVYLAEDADPQLTAEVAQLCQAAGIEPIRVSSMKALGAACGIGVGAAAAALTRAESACSHRVSNHS